MQSLPNTQRYSRVLGRLARFPLSVAVGRKRVAGQGTPSSERASACIGKEEYVLSDGKQGLPTDARLSISPSWSTRQGKQLRGFAICVALVYYIDGWWNNGM